MSSGAGEGGAILWKDSCRMPSYGAKGKKDTGVTETVQNTNYLMILLLSEKSPSSIESQEGGRTKFLAKQIEKEGGDETLKDVWKSDLSQINIPTG